MRITLINKTMLNLTSIVCDLGVRYFEDAKVNGEFDSNDKPRIPGAVDVEYEYKTLSGKMAVDRQWRWRIVIEPESGRIINWRKGTTANVHYKICDDCSIFFSGSRGRLYRYEGYVPSFLCIGDEGYGDYAVFSIDADGFIKDWKFSQSDFDECVKDNLIRG